MKKLDIGFCNDAYKIIVPVTQKQFNSEGSQMHNCVSSYYNRQFVDCVKVFFIRPVNDEKHSLYTMQANIETGKIYQLYAAHNMTAPDDAWEFARSYLRAIL